MSVSKMKKRKSEDKCRVFQEKMGGGNVFFSVVRDKLFASFSIRVSVPKE
jgi:hypothetical protein